MIAFIEEHRGVFGVGPICRVLGIASSTFYAHKAVERDPERASARGKQDALDKAIKRVFGASRGRYGARKVWHVLRREGRDIARCTVERLMRTLQIQGVVRGKKVITTNLDAAQPCPDDKVNRAFVADMPNQLWVSDFTYVSSWQGMVSFGPRTRSGGGQALTLRHRRLRPQDRRLARLHLDGHRFRAGRPEPSHLTAGTVRDGQVDPSQRSRQPIPVDQIYRTAF